MKKLEFTENELNKIKNLYLSGKPCSQICVLFNCHESTIKNKLKELNVKFRTNGEAHKKYSLDEKYFEKIDTKDKAYFLGLLIADGHANKKGFEISLQIEDRKVIDLFKSYIKYTGNLKIKKDSRKEIYKDSVRLTISRQKIAIDLSKFGIKQGKSYNAYFPDIPEEFHSHFIRGVFDGDGCICYSENRRNIFDICGNQELIEEIKNCLMRNCNITNKKLNNPNKNKNFVHLVVGNKKEIENIRNFIYSDCENLFINRKHYKMFNLI